MDSNGRIAITGRPGVGKTTLIRKLVQRLDLTVGGMLTEELRVCGHRVGFALEDLASGERGTLAHLHGIRGPMLGKYTVDIESLERIGVAAILRGTAEADLIVIDEIAPMELMSPRFVPAVEAALSSRRALVISTHAHTDHPLVHRVRRELTLFRVRLNNRDALLDLILEQFAPDSQSRPGDGAACRNGLRRS